jgi:Ca2+-transporting ATPase
LCRPLTATSVWVLGCTLLGLALVTLVPVVAHRFGFTGLSPLAWLGVLAAGLAMAIPLQASKHAIVSKSYR